MDNAPLISFSPFRIFSSAPAGGSVTTLDGWAERSNVKRLAHPEKREVEIRMSRSAVAAAVFRGRVREQRQRQVAATGDTDRDSDRGSGQGS
jgi:hypothetical protein